MKKLFPLQTFQQDAVLKRLSELSEIVPESLESDAGKVIMVGEDGNYKLGEVSGGTKLYKHSITFADDYTIEFISTSSEAYEWDEQDTSGIESIVNDIRLFGAMTWDNNESEYGMINDIFMDNEHKNIHYEYKIWGEGISHTESYVYQAVDDYGVVPL